MNIESGKAARRLGTLVPNPNAKLRDQFHEVCRFKYFSPRGAVEREAVRGATCRTVAAAGAAARQHRPTGGIRDRTGGGGGRGAGVFDRKKKMVRAVGIEPTTPSV